MKIKYRVALIVFLVFLMFNLSSCYIGRTQYFRIAPQDLKGNVKYFSEATYFAVKESGKIKKGDYRKVQGLPPLVKIRYENGNPLKACLYNSNNRLVEKVRYKHDDNGRRIEEKWYNRIGKLIFQENKTYDETGSLIEWSQQAFVSYLEHLNEKATFNYCENGLPIEYRYRSDGSLNYKTTYAYNELGQSIEHKRFLPDGSLFYMETYIYDEFGQRIQANRYSPDGSLSYKETYIYDQFGQRIHFSRCFPDGSLDFKHIYVYDEFGNRIEHHTYRNENKRYSRIYDEQGKLTSYVFYRQDGTVEKTIHDYEYDKHGNWIRKTMFVGENPRLITLRKIEYYD